VLGLTSGVPTIEADYRHDQSGAQRQRQPEEQENAGANYAGVGKCEIVRDQYGQHRQG